MRYLLLTLCLLSSFCLTASAATITVTNLNDSGPGSLRQAIADAAPGDTIDFSVTGTITLTSGQLVIDKKLRILGPGATLLAVSGNNASRVFYINSGITATLDGMTAQNGLAAYGGGIVNYYGNLAVTNSTVSGNIDTGGIVNYGGNLAVTNTTVSGNNGAGGIYNSDFGTLTVTNSIVSGNWGAFGIDNDQGTATVTNSTVSGNTSGGIFNSYFSTLTVSNSTVSGNIGYGGIVSNGTLTVMDSTISGNTAQYFGGGIRSGSSGTITNSTISFNFSSGDLMSCASSNGGGITGGNLTLTNTIVAGNTADYYYYDPGKEICYYQGNLNSDIGGTVASASHNLISDAVHSGGIQDGVNGNIVGFNALLGPLQNNGGPTWTHALLPGSPAVNSGDNCVLIANGCGYTHPALPTDQRGLPRRGNVDMGSFEFYSGPIPCTNCRSM